MHDVERSRRVLHIGLLLMVAGALALLLLGSRTTLRCERATGQCSIITKNVAGMDSQPVTIPLASLTGARLAARAGFTSWSASRHYRVVLTTASGEIDPFHNSAREDDMAALVDEINTYLRSTRDSLSVSDPVAGTRWVGAAFFCAGLMMVLLRSLLS